ncbi:hypothetical protein [Absidia glauca]|uniref:DNA helicase n=1 Tax=Absidia glauca TaxID=4829 RepID=A0A163MDJ3_ABSGL|nr:hypothetical protein [Absidia glauca]
MVLPSSPNRLKGFRSPSTAPSTSTTPDRSRRMMPVKDIMKSVRNLNNTPPTMDTSRFRLSPIRRSLDANDGSSLPNPARSLLPSLLTNPPLTSTTGRSHRRRTAALFDDHSDSSHTSAEEDGSNHDENSYDETSEDDDDDDGSSTHSTDTDDDDLDDYMDESTTMNIRLNAASVESKLALLRERFPTLSRGLLLQALHDNNGQFTKAMLQLDASAVPAPTPPRTTPSRKRRKRAHTPSSSSDDDDDQDRRQRRKTTTTAAAASWAGRRQMMEAAQTVAFFNTAKPQEIMDVVGCDLTQATKLISLRPFDHLEDLKAKLKEQPGLSVTYVDTYMDIMQGYLVVDQIIQSIEHRGTQLQTILNIWETIGGSPGAVDEEAGTHLTEMDLNKDHHLALDTSSAIYKDAMDGFLTQQPGILNPEFTLKPYQLIGVNWMLLLYRKGISGILADEMGLGKTAQVISFLGRLQELGVSRGPHMIVVPASTLDNWLREFERFCPALEVRCYYGSQAARLALQKELLGERNDIQAVVTTYSMVCGNSDDRRFLRKLRCDSMILDEGHMIKNYASARYDHLMRLKVPFRLLLTGTPLQNNLQELVSLLIFIMPKLFTGSEEDVHKIFKLKNSSAVTAANAASSPHNSTKAAQMLSQQRIDRAKKMMAPFVLRRRKAHVLNTSTRH